jgi:hypothetical protein
MSTRVLASITLACVVLASGCASVPMASPEQDTAARSYAVKPGTGNIYVYRNEILGAAITLPVELNGKPVGATGSKTFLLLPVAPGKHTLGSKGESGSTLVLDVAAGQNYFVWQEVKMGMLSGGSALHLVDEAKGKAGVAECKLVAVAGAGASASQVEATEAAPRGKRQGQGKGRGRGRRPPDGTTPPGAE